MSAFWKNIGSIVGVVVFLSGCGASTDTPDDLSPTATAVSDCSVHDLSCSPGTETATPQPGTASPQPGTATPQPAQGPGPLNPSLHNTLLGRPTDHSIALSVLADAAADSVSVDYSTALSSDGTQLAGTVLHSDPVTSAGGEPMVVELTGLQSNTRYYYRLQYQASSGPAAPDNVHTFMTQRAPGSLFTFGVQGDTHPERYNSKMFNAELMTLTMEQVQLRQPDFYVLLGDDFSIEKIIQDFEDANYGVDYRFQKSVEGSLPYEDYLSTLAYPLEESMVMEGVDAPKGYAAYRELRERYLGIPGNASSLFLVNGNHEQAHVANLGGIFNNAAIWAAEARLKYYPLPAPNEFYGGDTRKLTSINGYPTLRTPDGLLRDYYAFTWGDALFVTIDPYWHSEKVSPDSSLYNGDSPNKWDATMGDEQYNWLKQTLEGSKARWKFVFAHHINGTGRGGAACVSVQEWGGKLNDFIAQRPTWPKPIHALLVDAGVTVFFQGHDHTFAREVVDGVVYQEVPNPADNSYFAYNCTAYAPDSIPWQGPAGYGVYDPDESVVMPDTGFLQVTVAPEKVTVQYIRTYRPEDLAQDPNQIFTGAEVNGETAFRYSIPPQPDDDQASDFRYTCLGDAPPEGWVYLP